MSPSTPTSPLSAQRNRSRPKAVPKFWRIFNTFFGNFQIPYLVLAGAINLVIILDIFLRVAHGAMNCLTATASFLPVFEKMVGLVLLSYCVVKLARFIHGKTRESEPTEVKVKKVV